MKMIMTFPTTLMMADSHPLGLCGTMCHATIDWGKKDKEILHNNEIHHLSPPFMVKPFSTQLSAVSITFSPFPYVCCRVLEL